MGDIIFTREYEQINNLAEFKIYIDGEEVNSIENGKRKVIKVKAGKHEVFVKCMWSRSSTKQIEIINNETIRLSCGTTLKGLKEVFSWFFMIGRRWIYLENTI